MPYGKSFLFAVAANVLMILHPVGNQFFQAALRNVNLEENLQDLSSRLKRGAYRAKSVKRTFISKSDGHKRPLGIKTLENNVVQRAITEVLNAIYEADFLGFSYGFCPWRSPHDALDALYAAIMTKKVSWVLDADIRGYFDAINHECLIKFIERRMADKRVLRHIKKWLNAVFCGMG